MAFKLGEPDDGLDEVHDINVTPFIDVMLVLLIIFMVAAPLSTVDVAVDLPAANTTPSPRPDKPLFITLKSDLTVAIGETPGTIDTLASGLDQATDGNKTARVFLRADKTVPYGALMDVMNALQAAGYLKVALVGVEGQPRK